MVNDFRIEKSRLPVVLVTVDNERISGDLFVQASVRSRTGLETALDILNASEPFFPMASMKGETFVLSKDHVRALFVAREDSEEPDWYCGTTAEVEIGMQGGTRHKGTILIQQASGHRRVVDFLNRFRERFLAVHNDDGLTLLQRAQIVSVRQTA